MNEKYREQTIRAIIGSLLQSGMGPAELRRVAHEIKSGSFSYDLSRLLNQTLDVMEEGLFRRPIYSSYRAASSSEKTSESALLKRVKNRKLTKEQTIQLINQVAGPFEINPRVTLGEIVSEFYKRSSADQRAEFVSLVDSSPILDPYLKGLANRK